MRTPLDGRQRTHHTGRPQGAHPKTLRSVLRGYTKGGCYTTYSRGYPTKTPSMMVREASSSARCKSGSIVPVHRSARRAMVRERSVAASQSWSSIAIVNDARSESSRLEDVQAIADQASIRANENVAQYVRDSSRSDFAVRRMQSGSTKHLSAPAVTHLRCGTRGCRSCGARKTRSTP